ncbi:formate/nitrite transporter family protein [uncultured Jannaschia sp.]|uniref:formate/nitrite transporter family protein n=1 Tax=uncultured Jannaschia sp. TaxID=293347 RepID=UPI0026167F66|nr:formate/nitrite transporter family protein [uncultured Jannaschia sp.]
MQSDDPSDPRAEEDRNGYDEPNHRPEHHIDEAQNLTQIEEDKVLARLSLRAPAIYALIKEEGEGELARPAASLFWSGIAGGIAIGFSVLTLALLHLYLPDAEWTPLVASFGYATGFIVVIFGRLQLFTESTITAVLPVLAMRSLSTLRRLLRVWAIVPIANWLGCVLVATAFVGLGLVPAEIRQAILEVSAHYAELDAGTAFVQAIGAGFVVAVLVWTMPGAEGHKFALIAFTGWLIALAEFTHVIAGMVEIAALVLSGRLGALDGLFTLALPTLAGNVLGGTGLFALLAYASVVDEVRP